MQVAGNQPCQVRKRDLHRTLRIPRFKRFWGALVPSFGAVGCVVLGK